MAKRKKLLKHNNTDKVVAKTKRYPGKLRQDKIRKRKNFFPMLLVVFLSWGGVISIIYFVDPYSFGATLALFSLVFIALLFTFSVVFANSRRALITTFGIVLFLILAYLGIGNILNLFLIAGVLISIEVYLSRG